MTRLLPGDADNLLFNLGFGALTVDGVMYLIGYIRNEGEAP